MSLLGKLPTSPLEPRLKNTKLRPSHAEDNPADAIVVASIALWAPKLKSAGHQKRGGIKNPYIKNPYFWNNASQATSYS